MLALKYPQLWWQLFGPDAYVDASRTDGGFFKTHPFEWQMATATVFVCCGIALWWYRSWRFTRLLIFGPAFFGSFATIAQMHWMFVAMQSEWIGPTPTCDEVVRYALLSTHIGIAGTLVLFPAWSLFTRSASRAPDI